ncbi:MAG: hypothetical protein SGJ09_03245 [Phycisphaerae bacterium]|nr:hypothetical protein [Phycisphaerae bacterium]
MKRTQSVTVAAIAILARLTTLSSVGAAVPEVVDALPELTSEPWLYEVVRHLYRWYIDKRDVDAIVNSGTVTFWVRELTPALDEGDPSRFGEVILPQLALAVKVKLADYTIPELKVTVKSDRSKITSVGRIAVPDQIPDGYTAISAVYTEMRDELSKTRGLASFPEGPLLKRMRAAARTKILREAEHSGVPIPPGQQLVYLAPLSPIANEAWVFRETGRTLIRFASDIDLADPAVWDHQDLLVHV